MFKAVLFGCFVCLAVSRGLFCLETFRPPIEAGENPALTTVRLSGEEPETEARGRSTETRVREAWNGSVLCEEVGEEVKGVLVGNIIGVAVRKILLKRCGVEKEELLLCRSSGDERGWAGAGRRAGVLR